MKTKYTLSHTCIKIGRVHIDPLKIYYSNRFVNSVGILMVPIKVEEERLILVF